MLEILIELAVLAFWCLGIRIATGPEMIFERVDVWAADNLPIWLYKPIIGCVYCMASVHGAIIHAAFWYFFEANPWLYPFVAIPAVAVNGFVAELYSIIKRIAD